MDLQGKKILIAGASSDMAVELNEMLLERGAQVGLHYNNNKEALKKYKDNPKAVLIQKDLNSAKACYELVDEFKDWSGGIDYLVQLTGGVEAALHWEELGEEDWSKDLNSNLVLPFFLAQRAVSYMKDGGGRIVLMGTASASHGGGATSMVYGIAKAGVECMVKGLAKDCAKYNILVNGVAPGFIKTRFHTETKTEEQLHDRASMVPLKRAGTTKEVAAAIVFLLSEDAGYITGQVMAISGGDWL